MQQTTQLQSGIMRHELALAPGSMVADDTNQRSHRVLSNVRYSRIADESETMAHEGGRQS